MRSKGFCELGFAKIDLDRECRRGFSEAVYCAGKTKEQILQISRKLLQNKQDVILTKLGKNKFDYLKKRLPRLKYNADAGLAFFVSKPKALKGYVAVLTAGTSDIPVAEEAVAVLEAMGNAVDKIYDVGVAGVHRLSSFISRIRKANVIVVVAGMEGALASLVSGLVNRPVIAVPTSCGYGASFKGLAALLGMLNSCSAGVVVVNIDNGFGAGYFASLINR
jgi:NCAIR mutase (PurE)-related protein